MGELPRLFAYGRRERRDFSALHTWLTQQAKKKHRSLNAEIEYRLTKQREAEREAEEEAAEKGRKK